MRRTTRAIGATGARGRANENECHPSCTAAHLPHAVSTRCAPRARTRIRPDRVRAPSVNRRRSTRAPPVLGMVRVGLKWAKDQTLLVAPRLCSDYAYDEYSIWVAIIKMILFSA